MAKRSLLSRCPSYIYRQMFSTGALKNDLKTNWITQSVKYLSFTLITKCVLVPVTTQNGGPNLNLRICWDSEIHVQEYT